MHRFASHPLQGGDQLRPETPPLGRGPDLQGPGIRALFVLAPVLAFIVGVVRVLLEPTWTIGYLGASIALPAIIVAILIIDVRRGWSRPVAAVLLCVEAVAAGAFLPAGLAVAVILPIISVGLVQSRLRQSALLRAIAAAAAISTAGISLAVVIGPAHVLFGSTPAILTIAAFVAIDVFALALVWRSTRDLGDALDQAQRQISARGRTESELDRTAEILSAIVRSSPVATLAFGLDMKVALWNPAAERIFGWKADEILGGEVPDEIIPESERASWAARVQRTLGGSVTNGDRVQRQTKDGRLRWVDVYAAPLRDPLGKPIGITAQLVDVSDRVELEAQLLQAQKMETIGLLASGIAHDFNNTLTAAGGFAALIELNAIDDQIRTDAQEIVKAVDRARLLTGKLLAFGRQSEVATRSLDARSIVSGLLPLVRQLIGPETEIGIEVPAQPAMIRVDAGQLEQALINLAVNARDAMPDGGRLTLGVAIVEDTDRADGGRVEITVRDTGRGVPVELRERIFEPFFTTKGQGFGSGLGLAMVKGFAVSAGGEVTVASVVGSGTSFVICLPEVPAAEREDANL